MRRVQISLFAGLACLLSSIAISEDCQPLGTPPELLAARSRPETLVVNGSFETRQTGEPPVNIETLLAGSADLNGWQIVDSRIGAPEGPADSSPAKSVDWIGPTRWKAADGNYCLDLDGGIQQTIATVPGTEYELRFAMAANPELGPAPQVLRVLVNDHREQFQFHDPDARNTDLRWKTMSLRFTAREAKTTLTFVNAAPNALSAGVALDHVEVVVAGPQSPQILAAAGAWRVEFANGVVEQTEIRADGTASETEPLRNANGRASLDNRGLVIEFQDDRVERWTAVGQEMIVEHWFPAASYPGGTPVLGIGKRAAR